MERYFYLDIEKNDINKIPKDTTELHINTSSKKVTLNLDLPECYFISVYFNSHIQTCEIYNNALQMLEIKAQKLGSIKTNASQLKLLSIANEILDLSYLNITHLSIENSSLTQLKAPLSLTHLNITSCLSLSNIINLNELTLLNELTINDTKIGRLNDLPPNLATIDLSSNNLSILPILPNSVKTLKCSNNPIYILNLPTNLNMLFCSKCKLKSIDLCKTLKTVNISNNQITKIDLFEGLVDINIGNNPIRSVELWPATLKRLNINGTKIRNIDSIPRNIELLNISNTLVDNIDLNDLSDIKHLSVAGLGILALPYIPSTITSLNISFNNLRKLPKLPNTLTNLECQNNMLREITNLPSKLRILNCSNNRIKIIDKLPEGIADVICSHNLLEELPSIPESVRHLDCSFNNLTTLPNVKRFGGLIIDNNPITEQILPGVEHLSVSLKTIKYKGDDVNIITLPKGTILFRGYNEEKNIIDDYVGFRREAPEDNETIIPEDYNVFFYPYPFAVEEYFSNFKTFVIMALQYDVQIVSQVYPSTNTHDDMYRDYGYVKPCKARPYDPCLTADFMKEYPKVVGQIGLFPGDVKAMNDIYSDKVETFKYWKNFMDYNGYVGVPEVILYPFKERQKKKTFTEKDKTFESLNSRIKEYNYVPIVITNKENYKSIVDSLLSEEGYNGMKIRMNSLTHMYYLV